MIKTPASFAALRRAFTLIEILLVIAIMATIVSVGVVSYTHQSGAAKLRGATRGVFAAIRRARSEALVSGQPVVVSYSTVKSASGEVCAKVEIISAQKMGGAQNDYAETLSGEQLRVSEDDAAEGGSETLATSSGASGAVTVSAGGSATSGASGGEGEGAGGGEAMEDILFSPIAADVVEGVALEVKIEDEADGADADKREKAKISVYSNVDYLIGRYTEAKAKEKEAAKAKAAEDAESGAEISGADEEELREPKRVQWEVNGQVQPHRVYVHVAGRDKETGFQIKIDRFGAAKVLTPEDDEW